MGKPEDDPLLQLTREVFRRYFARLVARVSGGSQADFSKKTGIPDGHISGMLLGQRGRYVTVDVLVRVARGLNVPVSKLIGEANYNLAIAEAGELEKIPDDVEVVSVTLPDGSVVAMPKSIAERMKFRKAREAAAAYDASRPRPKPPKRKPRSTD